MLEKYQIVSLIDDLLNQTAKLRKGGVQATYFCPKCNHYKRKLEVSLDTFVFHCWTCDFKGNIYSLLKSVNAPNSAYETLHKLIGDSKSKLTSWNKPKDNNEIILPSEFHPLYKAKNSPEYKNAIAYLKRRKVFENDIVRYNIGYCESGEYQFHIIIPSYDANGELNFFVARRYYDVEGSLSYKKSPYSMNIVPFEIFINWKEDLNLCEGCFDAFAIRNNAVPLFGKYPSEKLLEKLNSEKVKRVNMILDDDALSDAIKNYEILEKRVPGIEVYIVKLSGKDPSVLGFKKTHDLIRNAKIFGKLDLMKYKLSI